MKTERDGRILRIATSTDEIESILDALRDGKPAVFEAVNGLLVEFSDADDLDPDRRFIPLVQTTVDQLQVGDLLVGSSRTVVSAPSRGRPRLADTSN